MLNNILIWLGIARASEMRKWTQEVCDLREGLQSQVNKDVTTAHTVRQLKSDLAELKEPEAWVETARLLLDPRNHPALVDLARLADKLESLGEDVETLETQVNDIESRVDDVESNDVASRVDDIENAQNETESNITTAVDEAISDINWNEKLTVTVSREAEFEVSSF